MKGILIIWSLLIIPWLPAQERKGEFIAYPARLGLSESLNYRVCESSDGYLWIGTDNGLVKFDGKHYQRILAGPASITDNYVIDVAEDTRGWIWIAGFWNGCSYFNPKTQVFRRFPKLGESGSDMQQVNKIVALADGQILLATGNMGLALYHADIDSFEFFKPQSIHQKDSLNVYKFTVNDMVQDPNHSELIWLIQGDNLFTFNTRSYEFISIPILNKKKFPKLYFTAIAHNDKNVLWLGTWGQGLMRFNLTCGYLDRIAYKKQDGKFETGMVVLDVAQINDSITWWACSVSGLYEFNTSQNYCTNISPTLQNEKIASSDYQAISKTKSGSIFLGLSGYLLHWNSKFNRLLNKLVLAPHHAPLVTYLSNLVIDPNEKYYYFACAGPESLIRFYTSNPSQQIIPVMHPTSVSGLKEMHWMNSKQLIALGYDGLLYSMSHSDSVMKPLNIKNNVLESIGNMIVDATQVLWIRKKAMMYRFCLPEFELIDSFSLKIDPVPAKYKNWPLYVYQIASDPMNRIWLSSNQGFFMIDPTKPSPVQIAKGTALGAWMRHDLIRSFYIDPDETIWIGYNGDGLQRMDLKSFKEDSRLNTISLPSQTINDISMTVKGEILLATSAGLIELNPVNYNWQVFGVQDGLAENNIESGLFVTPDGMVFIPQLNSYHLVHEHNLTIDHEYLKINITEFKVNDSSMNLSIFHNKNPVIKFHHKQNNLSIKFAAMHKEFPWRTQYSYRFFTKGDTSSWHGVEEPILQFSALQAGEYTLQLKALGAGNTISWPKQIFISILPPFWKTWWFILCLNGIVLLLLYGLYRFRIQQIRKPLEIRTLISRNLHDDIGSSLSNIQILNELARRNLNDTEKARSFLDKSKEDLLRISEALSDIVWNVSPKYDDLNNLFIRMRRYAADILEGKQINYEFHFPEQAVQIKLRMEFRREFYLIFKESLHNMTKYSKATKALINLEIKDGFILLNVTDNGIGFEINKIRLGHGLENMKHRAQKCNGTLEIISEPDKGTTIICKIPFQ
jgi:ligand-binding sensor domain-containing protein/two-component sensor histidine kinase